MRRTCVILAVVNGVVACRGSAADGGGTSGPVDVTGSSTSGVASDGSASAGNTTAHPDETDAGSGSTAPAELPTGPEIGPFQLTYYWVAAEADHPGRPTATLY